MAGGGPALHLQVSKANLKHKISFGGGQVRPPTPPPQIRMAGGGPALQLQVSKANLKHKISFGGGQVDGNRIHTNKAYEASQCHAP